MPQFEYHVKDKTGNDKTGVQDSSDVEALVSELRNAGYIIIRIQEIKEKKSFFKIQITKDKKTGKSGNVVLDDLVVFSRQMATLVDAGIPLIQALDILADQVEKEKLRETIKELHQSVQAGKSLSDAMEKHGKIFSELFVNMVRAGESSGSLEEILDRVASYLEKASILQKKVKSALMYPATVTLMAFLITFGMMAFVIPKFASIFEGLNAELPVPTKILIQVSYFLQDNWLVVLGSLAGIFFGLGKALKLPGVHLAWDSAKLKFPIFGPIMMKVAVSKFSRTLSTLVKSGVSILTALDIVSRTSENKRLEMIIRSLINTVQKGEGIAGQLGKSDVFPSMVVKMIAIGEETGELETMLLKIADFYDSEVDSAVDGLTSLIEPLIIAFLGIVIGGIVIAMFLPIFTLTSAIK